jgi:RNA polymerase sigma factor (sigma-70 family)
MSDAKQPAGPTPADGFGSTRWSLILSAQRNDDDGSALNQLCSRYWKPVYVFARRDGLAPQDAEDATQEFFAYLLERSWLQQADPARGSFRGFVQALLRNFLSNRRRHASAQKRGGAKPGLLPPTAAEKHELEQLAASDLDPAAAYERVWALAVLQAALTRLAVEQERLGQAARFTALRPFLTHAPTPADYDRLARELGQPRNNLAVSLHRLSRRYSELIRAEVIDTLAEGANVETELRSLIDVLSL